MADSIGLQTKEMVFWVDVQESWGWKLASWQTFSEKNHTKHALYNIWVVCHAEVVHIEVFSSTK